MIYHHFRELSPSSLGLGCMRLPTKGQYSEIDVDATREMVAYALSHGINYFDTAYGYHGGSSERVMGELLADYPRESFLLASKFPGFTEDRVLRVREIFEEQLERCRTPYFDFYLFHSVMDSNADLYLDPKYGLLDYFLEQKRQGRIRHLGFSTHASLDTTRRFLDTFGEAIEFCQIQLNWLDYTLQDARAKVELLNERQIPIWVMEPVRGGGLCRLPSVYEERLRALAPDRTLPAWCFRYLQSIPGVTVVLSGMSDMTQLRENIATFEAEEPLTERELTALYAVARDMTNDRITPCTACRYCTERCPAGLDIPALLALRNEHAFDRSPSGLRADLAELAEQARPSACLGCGACEAVCPQGIAIPALMTELGACLA